MSVPADPCPIDAFDGLVEFRVDPDAEPGNVVPAMAALLIDLVRGKQASTFRRWNGEEADA